MVDSFFKTLGRKASAERTRTGTHQYEPPGLSPELLAQWRSGYGGEGLPCVLLAKLAKPLPTPVDLRPYSAFSTKKNKRRAPCQQQTPTRQKRTTIPARPQVETPLAGLTQLPLFGEVMRDPPRTKVKPPAPIPQDDRDAELTALVNCGVGISQANELVAREWTLDQLIVQCLRLATGSDETNLLPRFVVDVLPIVERHIETMRQKRARRANAVAMA